jgi:hypothetical protein
MGRRDWSAGSANATATSPSKRHAALGIDIGSACVVGHGKTPVEESRWHNLAMGVI